MAEERIRLGDYVRDIYTKFEGIACGRTQWLHGCDRIGIEPTKLDKDGKPVATQWFDDQRVELVERMAVKVVADAKPERGGPRDDPQQPGGF